MHKEEYPAVLFALRSFGKQVETLTTNGKLLTFKWKILTNISNSPVFDPESRPRSNLDILTK